MSTTPNEPYSCVRIGGDPNHIHTLCQSLSHHFPCSRMKQKDGYIFNIQNKYFHAKVNLESFSIITTHPNNDVQEEDKEDPLKAQDGIILLIDHHHPNAISTILTPMNQSATATGSGDTLRLCVSILPISPPSKKVTSKEEEDLYSERVLWCLDHGYEYIEKVDLSSIGIQQGFEEREKEGFARVVEAIQSTIWSTASRHQVKKMMNHQQKEHLQDQIDLEKSILRKDNDDNNLDEEESTNEKTTTNDSSIQKQTNQTKVSDILQQIAPPIQEHSEAQFHHLDSLLQQVNQIRQATKANADTISDKERRTRAADIAIKLLDVLDLSGEEDSDEEGN